MRRLITQCAQIKSSVLLMVVTSLVVTAQAVHAAPILHTQVEVSGRGSGALSLPFDQTIADVNSASLGPVVGIGDGNGTQIITAFAQTNPFGNSLIHLDATAASDNGFLAIAYASGAWRDIIYPTTTSTPSSLRLHFVVEGGLQVTLGSAPSGGEAHITTAFVPFEDPLFGDLQTANVTNNGSFPNGASNLSHALFRNDTFSGSQFDPVGFSSLAGTPGSFVATFTYDAPFDSAQGGYTWNLTSYATAVGNNGAAASHFGQTIRLEAVTLTDGTPIAPADLRFDSGLQLTAVPEPTSLVMLSTGLLSLVVFARRRVQVRRV